MRKFLISASLLTACLGVLFGVAARTGEAFVAGAPPASSLTIADAQTVVAPMLAPAR